MWLTLVLLAFVWPFGLCNDPDLPFNLANTASNREMCWERCFQVEDDDSERFREVYDDFYKMGMEARRLKNMYGVNGTAILLDSTLSAANPEELPSDGNGPNYVVWTGDGSTADQIWEFQRNLAAIVMMIMGSDDEHNPVYLVQFNENGASTCEEFHCLHACEADYIMDSELDSPDIESYKHGNIEVACHVSKRFISRTPCEAKISNEMAIGFLNSGIKFEKSIHDESSSEENDPALKAFGKACLNHFNTRMAVGTHVARWADLDEWSSKAARPFYFHDNRFTREAAATLRSCLRTRCCATTATYYLQGITGNICKKSDDSTGYNIDNFYGHSSYGAS